MSLRWRIMGATVLVIVLTVLISIGVGYYTTQFRLGMFVNEIGEDEASRLARNLSREYTAAGGWETVDKPLSEAGYIYDDALHREESEDSEGESSELFHKDPIRVVIVGVDGRVVKDNLSELPIRNHRARSGRASRDDVRFDYEPAGRPRLCGCRSRVPID